jgi:hydrogenase nickel incorporation protein HypB
MCVTCGCSDGSETTYTSLTDNAEIRDDSAGSSAGSEPHVHSHRLADGRVVTHSHATTDQADAHAVADRNPHHHHGSEYHHGYDHYQQQGHPHAEHHAAHSHGAELGQMAGVPSSSASPGKPQGTPLTHTTAMEINVLAKNDLIAAQNRGWFEGRHVLALNLMSSPGAGKTTLLTRTINDLKERIHFSVIEGDQATVHDAQRIRETGCNVVQVNTGTGCHLEAEMVQRGIQTLNPPSDSVLMIENVGNLVCPALFDLGERAKVAILSVTEGDDKPIKYPHLFRACNIMLLNKIDLLPYVSFEVDRCLQYARQVNPDIQVFQVSATSGEGLDHWYGWILEQLSPVEVPTI